MQALEDIGGEQEIEILSWYARSDDTPSKLKVYAVLALKYLKDQEATEKYY